MDKINQIWKISAKVKQKPLRISANDNEQSPCHTKELKSSDI